ncbi:VWA domain-containing protein [Candidatus Poribacteria bacterium]
MLKPGKTGETQRKVRRAAEYLKAGDLENAEVWFEEALALDPNSKKALAGLGKVSRLKKIKEHLAEGLALLDQGNLEEADRELRQVISLEPKNAAAIAGLGQIAQLRKLAERPQSNTVSSASVSEHLVSQKEHSIEKIESFIDHMRRNKQQARQSNVTFLLVSCIAHLVLFIFLSIFIADISYKPKEYISIEWVDVDDPRSPTPKPLTLITEKKLSDSPRTAGEHSVKSLADRVTKTNIQVPRQDPRIIGTVKPDPRVGERTLPRMSSAVEMTDLDSDLMFSTRKTMAAGSNLKKPGVSNRPGPGSPGRGMGGLSTIQSSAAAEDGLSGVSLGGLMGQGLLGPDPMDMVSAVTFDRKPQETVVFLLDISNSMEGNYQRGVYNREWFKKLKRAKRSIISSLYKLRTDEDKFYLAAFSSDLRLFSKNPVVVNQSSLAEVTKFVEELRPTTHRERTDLYKSLMSALGVKPTRIIVVSDGLPTSGVVSVKNILNGVKQKNKGARIYTFATNLGNQPQARVLLSKMARDNDGKFTNDKMGLPRGIAVNSAGDIYVADVTVKIFDKDANYVRSFGSHATKLATGPSDDIHLLFFPSASSSGFGALGVCRSDGTQLKSFASHGHLPRQLYHAWGVAADSKGNTYVVSTRSNKVSIFDRDGNYVRSFGSAGMQAYETGPSERGDSLTGGSRRTGVSRRGVNSNEKGYFSRPMSIALDSYDNIYVLDSGNRRVQMFNPQFQYEGEFRIDGMGMDIAVDAEGKYIHVLLGSSSTGGDEIYIYRPDGAVVEKFNAGSGTADIDLDPAGNIYALSFIYDEVNIFSRKGNKLRSFSTIQ